MVQRHRLGRSTDAGKAVLRCRVPCSPNGWSAASASSIAAEAEIPRPGICTENRASCLLLQCSCTKYMVDAWLESLVILPLCTMIVTALLYYYLPWWPPTNPFGLCCGQLQHIIEKRWVAQERFFWEEQAHLARHMPSSP